MTIQNNQTSQDYKETTSEGQQSDHRQSPIKPMRGHQEESSSDLSKHIPEGVVGWNWGAFLIPFFWTICMKLVGWTIVCYILWIVSVILGMFLFSRSSNPVIVSLNIIVNVATLGMTIYLGKKGNELAWKSRKWDSVGQFKSTQAVWNRWGIGILITIIVLIIIVPMIIILTTNCRPY